jgi:hypothetical protein
MAHQHRHNKGRGCKSRPRNQLSTHVVVDRSDRVLFTGGAIGLELAGRGNDLNSSE